MFNKVILAGNLTKDPELRYTPQGLAVSSFRLAVNSRYGSKGEESKDETLFIDITAFGRQGEVVSQYLSKGGSVLVEGRLRERSWESEGQRRSKMEVIANSVTFLGGKGGSGGGPKGGGQDRRSEDPGGMSPPDEITDLEPF